MCAPPMDIEKLSARAMEIRNRFAELEHAKFRRPWTKEEVMQGFVGDVGDLMKLVMAKSGIRHIDRVDEKLAHELSDCLWSVLVLAKMYGLDIEKEFTKTMRDLENRMPKKVRDRTPKPSRRNARRSI
jgi:NTP pyrophosphatase (non-canonical NTP hydrolase)